MKTRKIAKQSFLLTLTAALALGAIAERNGHAADPTIEVYDAHQASGFSGGGISAGVELSTFPSPNFIVGVDFRGIGNASGTLQYFMVSGKISFNEGTSYVDSRQHPDAPFIDIDIVPVSSLMAMQQTAASHSVTSARWVPVQIHRDIKLLNEATISVHAWGLAHDTEAPIWTSNPKVRSFIHTAVDLIGYRYMLHGLSRGIRPNDDPEHSFHGFEIGTAQAELGMKWDLSQKVQFRVSVGGTLNAAVLAANGHASLITESDFFARLELVMTRATDSFSVYLAPGARVLTNDPVNGDAISGYGYLQIGIRGTFQ